MTIVADLSTCLHTEIMSYYVSIRLFFDLDKPLHYDEIIQFFQIHYSAFCQHEVKLVHARWQRTSCEESISYRERQEQFQTQENHLFGLG